MIAFKLTTCSCYTDGCSKSSLKLPEIFDFNFLSINFPFPNHDIQALLSFKVFKLLNIFKRLFLESTIWFQTDFFQKRCLWLEILNYLTFVIFDLFDVCENAWSHLTGFY